MSQIALSAVQLRPDGALYREPPRPEPLRPKTYEQEFDYLTVFYDSFWSADGAYAVFIGPPLLNIAKSILPGFVRAFGIGPARDAVFRHLRLHDQFWLRTNRASAELSHDGIQEKNLIVQQNLSHLFRGKKVLLTKSKDNELIWIKDWVHFHAAHHGSNAVLLYDNASTKYESDEIRLAIASVRGIEVALVIDWPYKFGPRGHSGVWDSDFSQYAILEHARHRALAFAHSVICGDIDELVLTDNNASLHELAAKCSTGYLLYGGHWIENAAKASDGIRRHAEFVYCLNSSECESKWTVVPERCPWLAQWQVHYVSRMTPDAVLSGRATIRHFKAINTNWKVARAQSELPLGGIHFIDETLMRAFSVFA